SSPPPPPDDCAGLVPPAPGAANLSFAQPTNDGTGTCGPGYTDGDGTLVLPWGGMKGPSDLTFVSRDGAVLSRYVPEAPAVLPTEQEDGFVTWDASQFYSSLARFNSSGVKT